MLHDGQSGVPVLEAPRTRDPRLGKRVA